MKKLLLTWLLGIFLLPVGIWAQQSPFDDSPVKIEKSAVETNAPIAEPAAPTVEQKPAESPAAKTSPAADSEIVAEIPVGKVATFTITKADIIEQAGELICMAGNPVGCLIAVVAGIYKHRNDSTWDKASTIGDLAPLGGPIGIVGKAVQYANYGKVAYDNKDKIQGVLQKATKELDNQQPPAPIEEREIIPLLGSDKILPPASAGEAGQ